MAETTLDFHSEVVANTTQINQASTVIESSQGVNPEVWQSIGTRSRAVTAAVMSLTASMKVLGLITDENEVILQRLTATVVMIAGSMLVYAAVRNIVDIARNWESAQATADTAIAVATGNWAGIATAVAGVGLFAASFGTAYAVGSGFSEETSRTATIDMSTDEGQRKIREIVGET